MRTNRLILMNVLSVTILVTVFITLALAGQTETTIIGVVKDDYHLETVGGKLIKVAETEMGIDLLERVGEKMEVMGVITEENGVKVIRVTAFTAVEE